MSNNTITLAEIASKPMSLTEHGRYAYWYLRTSWNRALVEGDTRVEYDPPNQYQLTDDDVSILRKALKRVRLKIEVQQAQRELTFTRDLAMLVVGYLGKRRFFKSQIRKDYNLTMVMDSVRRNFNRSELLKMGRTERQRKIGNWLRVWEKRLLREAQSRIEQSYYDRLPLYECSGELEAQSLRTSRWTGDRHLSTNRVRSYKTPYWDVGHDGGGQPEIRFRITQKLPDVACNLVNRIGSIDRNGGHIHLNCKRDEAIGRSVYFAMRNHLSWFRYLAPLTRRQSRWCNVQDTMSDWESAKSRKYAAVSAGQFNRLGTIEVRLWPTSRKPSEWRFRASLMQAIAKWSEDHAECSGETPISNDTAVQAWGSFYRWAAIHEPSILKEVLKVMKAKARTASSSNRRLDRFGATKCDEFVRQFDTSDTRLRGYRRVERQPVAAASYSTDD
jgi:hypothetical protein